MTDFAEVPDVVARATVQLVQPWKGLKLGLRYHVRQGVTALITKHFAHVLCERKHEVRL